MDLFSALTFIGGLSLFLYGMDAMGKGLEKNSGGKLKKVLARLTSNPIKGVILGAGVTALIQSSSATTVMVIGFVNSGIMELSQAISIIMGANIGTTITAWILSLTGIQGSNIFLRLLKPSSFSPILALIGIIFALFAKSQKKKDIGGILLGFAVLMFGMETMTGAVRPLAEMPEFRNLLTVFSNPLVGVLTGALVTGIIQSSSASVGILQALSVTGTITYSMAIPIIMGQNIGTCVTALISSIGASKNAKRAAMVHLYFNIIGSALFLVLYYVISLMFDLTFINDSINVSGVAIIHSIFNVLSTLVLLPFTKQLEKLAKLTVKNKGRSHEDNFRQLDEYLLASPSVATSQCMSVTCKMAELSRDTLFNSISMLNVYSKSRAEEIKISESLIDQYEDRIGDYLIKLSTKDLSEKDNRKTTKMLHCIGDFERISDHAVNLLESANELKDKKIRFNKEALEDIMMLSDAIKEIINITTDSFINNDIKLAKSVEPLEEVIDGLQTKLKDRHIDRLKHGGCTTEIGFIFSDIITNYERIADHCSNIAICVIQIDKDEVSQHGYVKSLRASDSNFYHDKLIEYSHKYCLS